MELINSMIEFLLKLSKKNKIILGSVVLFIILFLLVGGIGSNNDIVNTNKGIQGNGNNQNTHNNSGNTIHSSTNNGIHGNGNTQNSNNHTGDKINHIYFERQIEKPFKENFTEKKTGYFVITNNWKKKWKPYLTIYENFVDIPTPKGYLLLNSPNQEDIYKAYNEKAIEVSGYIRTTNGIFYVTKYSYDNREKNGFPKFIYPIR